MSNLQIIVLIYVAFNNRLVLILQKEQPKNRIKSVIRPSWSGYFCPTLASLKIRRLADTESQLNIILQPMLGKYCCETWEIY